MTEMNRFDPVLRRWLDRQTALGTPDYIDDVLSRTARTRQRPSWTFPGRWLPMDLAVPAGRVSSLAPRLLLLGLLLLAAIVLALVIVGSQNRVQPFANGLVAFEVDGDIFVQNVDGTGRRAVLAASEFDTEPIWSPGGDRLAFIRLANGGRRLYVLDLASSSLVKVSDIRLVSRFRRSISWSPDGTQIAFIGAAGGPDGIYVARVDGTSTRRLSAENLNADSPAWRPNGSTLLFRAGPVGGDIHLYIGDPVEGTVEQLTTYGGREEEYEDSGWSPDGTQIAYHSGRTGLDIHVMNADGSGDRVVYRWDGTNEGYAPEWSPDGRRLCFQLGSLGVGYRLAVVSADGSDSPLQFGPLFQTALHTWSPDGTRIIAKVDGLGDVVLIDPATGEVSDAPWTSLSHPAWQRLQP